MGLFDGEDKLAAARAYGMLEGKVEQLERENRELKDRCVKLEERVGDQLQALIAIQHPQSFRDLQDARAIDDPPEVDQGLRDQYLAEQRIMREYAYEQEQPLFKGPEDMFALFDRMGKSQGTVDPAGHSVHGNEES